jgi:hypothetical protein
MFWRATNGNFAANFRAHPKAETIAAAGLARCRASRQGPFTERTAGIQAVRRERVLMCRFLDAGKNEALGTLS